MSEEWLIGWKKIATYLRCSVRAAQYYHENGRMPVRTPPGMMVRALKADLDIWHEKYTKTPKKQ